MTGISHRHIPHSAALRASSSLLDDLEDDTPVTEEASPSSPLAGKQLQREASASILCRQASELRRDSSQADEDGLGMP